MRAIAVIPARYSSTRLPGKPLADLCGKPMIQHVFERASQSKAVSEVWIATDHPEIERVARGFGARVMMTDPALASGTDRVAAVARQVQADLYINVQGDEPLLNPIALTRLVELIRDRGFDMASLMSRFKSVQDYISPHIVKVLTSETGQALYFSRLPIPYGREVVPEAASELVGRRHMGLYAYKREVLERLCSLPVSSLEQAEGLEQLRALQAGVRIGMAEVEFESIGVDTPEDLAKVREWLNTENTSS